MKKVEVKLENYGYTVYPIGTPVILNKKLEYITEVFINQFATDNEEIYYSSLFDPIRGY